MQSEKEGDDRLCTSNVAPVAGLFQNKEIRKEVRIETLRNHVGDGDGDGNGNV